MKKVLFSIIVLMCGLALQASPRKVINLDMDWYFHLGDVEAGETAPYSDWRLLDIPHDWSIEGDYSRDVPGGDRVAWLPTGIGWYKKEVEWNPDWAKKYLYDGHIITKNRHEVAIEM